jgi:DNA-binding GntR family transcriptional regulator
MLDTLQLQMNEYLPLRDVVFQTLRQAILKGELEPGERLMEIHLAQKLGVSRTPVREAIRKLELEGLVLMIPRRGAVVADITVSDLEDVLEVRLALEELAVRQACRNYTPEQMKRLKSTSMGFKHSLYGEDVIACAQADEEFHAVVYEMTGNRKLVQILNNLREQMYRYRTEYLKDKHTHAELVSEHEELVQALEQRDEKRAMEIMEVHVERQKEYMIRHLEKK